jgi:hypothetical protein
MTSEFKQTDLEQITTPKRTSTRSLSSPPISSIARSLLLGSATPNRTPQRTYCGLTYNTDILTDMMKRVKQNENQPTKTIEFEPSKPKSLSQQLKRSNESRVPLKVLDSPISENYQQQFPSFAGMKKSESWSASSSNVSTPMGSPEQHRSK